MAKLPDFSIIQTILSSRRHAAKPLKLKQLLFLMLPYHPNIKSLEIIGWLTYKTLLLSFCPTINKLKK